MMLAKQIILNESINSVINSTTDRPLSSNKQSNICLHGSGDIVASVHSPSSPERARLEAFIKEAFKRAHGASIHYFMPELMSLHRTDGTLMATCGLRPAGYEPLFLERYLSSSVEQVLSDIGGTGISRHGITEIGNLAVAKPENIRCLLACINLYMHRTDTEWAVFTGTRSLKNALVKLNMPLLSLGHARIDHIPPEERGHWGKYYEENPEVLAIKRTTQTR